MSLSEIEGPFWDPLGYQEPLPFAETFFPIGFPLILKTNSEEILAAARDSLGEYCPEFDTPPMEMRVIVKGRSEGAISAPEAPVFRGQGNLFSLALDHENVAACDLDRGLSCAWLSPAVARDRLFTSFYFLDPMAYLCLGHKYLTPMHAACVALDGKGILLLGESHAGKSSLAWACARAGMSYLADDAAWLLRRSSDLTVLGKPQRIRFRPNIVEILPELAALPRMETVTGKHSFEIPTAAVPGLTTARRCRPAWILLLSRRPDGPAELVPVDGTEARHQLRRARTVYEKWAWEEQEASIERLLAGSRVLELRYSRLPDAVERIRNLR